MLAKSLYRRTVQFVRLLLAKSFTTIEADCTAINLISPHRIKVDVDTSFRIRIYGYLAILDDKFG